MKLGKLLGPEQTSPISVLSCLVDAKYTIQLWHKVNLPTWLPHDIFAMAPYVKMFRASNCTTLPSFILLWRSKMFSDISPGLSSFVIKMYLNSPLTVNLNNKDGVYGIISETCSGSQTVQVYQVSSFYETPRQLFRISSRLGEIIMKMHSPNLHTRAYPSSTPA